MRIAIRDPMLGALAVFLLGLAVVALVSSIYAPTRRVTFPLLIHRGGASDTGPLGHSAALELLRATGHPIYTTLPPAEEEGPVAVLLPAWSCSNTSQASLERVAQLLRARGGLLIVEALPSALECLGGLLHGLGAPRLPAPLGGFDAALAAVKGGEALLALGAPAAEAGGWSVLGEIVRSIPETAHGPVVLLHLGPRVAVVVFYSALVFTNNVLSVAADKGLGNARLLVALIDSYAGPRAPVYLEEGLLPREPPPSFVVDPGAAVLGLLGWSVSIERIIVESLASSPLLYMLAILALGLILYALLHGRSPPVAAEEEPQLEGPYRVVGGTGLLAKLLSGHGLTTEEARQAIVNLYEMLDALARERLGKGLTELAFNPVPLGGLPAEEVARRLRRLRALYIQAKDGRSGVATELILLPRWHQWLREALELAEPLFRVLGVSLEGEG